MRLVLDTNVVAAGLLWEGPPNRLVEEAFEGKIELATSAALLVELEGVLLRAKFARQIAKQSLSIAGLVLRYAELAQLAHPAPIAPVVLRDPDDDHVLACAIAAKADLVVSGDSDLLELGQYQGIPIVNPAEALTRLPQR
ncbi:MAG: putative toxin-antitoxin system toxin component, PIN family [Betaproteobacteria bacterium]|nr:putative toxin-antitoxin system toxin component, PIN family [Betaproteobacteria bacterium]